jgi:CRP-like cAMP-binding protein
MAATIEQLRGVPLFHGMPDKALTHVLALAKEVRHEAGKPILEEDHSGIGFHLIVGGNATVSVGGSEVARFGPGDYFGEMSIIDGLPRSATVTAVDDVTTLAIASWDFEGLMEQHPSMMRAMLVELSGRIRQIEKTRS